MIGCSKEKNCKCTHDKKDHKFSWRHFEYVCTICKCKSYYRKDRPTRFDFSFQIFYVAFCSFVIAGLIVLSPFVVLITHDRTELQKIILEVSLGVGIVIYLMIITSMEYYKQSQREVKPVE